MNGAAYDVFNGDADGICALHQLRLAEPKPAQLVSGVKRDIALLARLPPDAAQDVTVLDLSLDCNVVPLKRILDAGGRVSYFDHHSARLAFAHPRLQLFWDDSPQVCSSILVDRHLGGRFRPWAAVAAFGDNLPGVGRAYARELGYADGAALELEELGLVLNYNAYGETVDDLHIAPDALYQALHAYRAPHDFIHAAPEYARLIDGYRRDIAHMESLTPQWQSACGAVYLLPGAPWARRISGVFANRLICPERAASYAVLTENADGSYVVSVRSGAPALRAASALCERFPGGGGRKAAAGINRLPAQELDRFVQAFSEYFAVDAMPTARAGQHG
ncbi:hypothetical protein AAKU55_003411 [Oxalobacteraceae bacterium GrIS 1.11]